ncbi:hypothetical protein RHSIM_Rhsim03G0012400 [Rhododendron simsii]|uniref:Disease resistance protein At4g27190-like leucine-rich repeats domain-containing protein n=1 Tax=Rhododendron simsii TaxID=118357 RepID=A0A834H398_RHOSS|nr:hypothetical protein RHSIM_Rhsim03G0012400 [Rhododendron simsii]
MKGMAEFEGEIDEDGLRNEVASLAREHLEMVGAIKIRIEACNQLLYVFPSHMLPQNLQHLWIENCDELEVIFSKDPKVEKEAINDDIIVFPRLERVILQRLPKLRSFYTETQGFFSHKVAFPVLEHLHFLNLDKITRIWDNQPLPELEKEAKSLSELKDIIVEGCNQLEMYSQCWRKYRYSLELRPLILFITEDRGHNDEELDEDLKTPTKKVRVVVAISGEDTRIRFRAMLRPGHE